MVRYTMRSMRPRIVDCNAEQRQWLMQKSGLVDRPKEPEKMNALQRLWMSFREKFLEVWTFPERWAHRSTQRESDRIKREEIKRIEEEKRQSQGDQQ